MHCDEDDPELKAFLDRPGGDHWAQLFKDLKAKQEREEAEAKGLAP